MQKQENQPDLFAIEDWSVDYDTCVVVGRGFFYKDLDTTRKKYVIEVPVHLFRPLLRKDAIFTRGLIVQIDSNYKVFELNRV